MSAPFDPLLTLLAVGVAVFGMMSVVALTAHLRDAALSEGQVQLALVNGALTVGVVTWATHFIALHALGFPASIGQNPVELATSLVLAMCAAWSGLYVANLGWGGIDRLLGGVMVGLGVIAIHYRPLWYALGCGSECNEPLMLGLAGVAVAATAGSIWIAFRGRGVWRTLLSGLMLGLAAGLMSYSGLVGTYAVPSFAADWNAPVFENVAAYAVGGGIALLSGVNIALLAAITKHRLTGERIALVQGTYDRVERAGVAVADLFYQRLFEIAPQTRALFPADISQQKSKLLDVLAGAVLNLHQLDVVAASIRDLGRRHVYYGVTPEHYQPVGDALIWTLERLLGNEFTPATRRAWIAAYKTLSRAMLSAAAEVKVPQQRQRQRVRVSARAT